MSGAGRDNDARPPEPLDGVAIIGMAIRVPGAADLDAFWHLLCEGREAIRRFAPDELSPLTPLAQRTHPSFVPARGVLENADRFDAAFFGISAREARLIDPQQRVFLELAWNAFEHAGYEPARAPGSVGVFAGSSNNTYYPLVRALPEFNDPGQEFAAAIANEKDYIATRVAHKLGLTGPAISMYSACSTSLVAVAQAWYALMSGQCDFALAGGINIVLPQESGYVAVDGGIESLDGHCRPFDAAANGTVFSSGGGAVVLRRLSEARADGDTIHAVIRGVGVNNDGANKATFSAPSVRGQAEVIGVALATAGVDAPSIGYVEAHGTATPLGDPIEVEALTRAFRSDGEARPAPCWLGSLKGNIGHLVAGAGIAGLIKATLALERGCLPPTLHFQQANPAIDFGAGLFRVADRLTPWPRGDEPRRAGVSSFGVGGTNAHVVLEEAPLVHAQSQPRAVALLPLSARDDAALARRAQALAADLALRSDADLHDVAATLAFGRKPMATRGYVVARTVAQARERLSQVKPLHAPTPRVAFLFPGQGSQHVNMARELVATEPVFRDHFDAACALAAAHLDRDLRSLILPPAGDEAQADALLAQTRYTQPALFVVEHALARWWQSVGLVPDTMIGHSVGEYVAATLAEVFSLETAVALVCARAAAMQAQPGGAMLGVRAAAASIDARLPPDVALAAVNGADLCVVAGSDAAIDAFAQTLKQADIASTRLKVSHAFHSALMDGALPVFERAFDGQQLHAPTRAFYSCVTGAPISAAQATDPGYWLRQLRVPVRFADAVTHALGEGASVLLEVGPSQSLTTFARSLLHGRAQAVASLGPAPRPGSDAEQLANAFGACWSAGCTLDWTSYYAGRAWRRVALAGYPFAGDRHWIDDVVPAAVAAEQSATATSAATPVAPPPAVDAARAEPLRRALRELVENLSGETVGPASDGVSFVALGLDSLSLTQLALELERRHGVKLKFRRLLEDLDSIDKLVAVLGGSIAAVSPPPADSTPVAPTEQAVLLSRLMQGQQSMLQQQAQLLAALAAQVPAAPAAVDPSASALANAPAIPAPTAAGSPAASTNDTAPADLAARPFGASARINLAHDLALTPPQRRWLDEFTRTYNARTAKSKAFAQRHRARMADPRVVTGFNPLWKELVYPIVVERSKGAHLTDIDGNDYVDCLNAFGANFLGYQPDFIATALKAQIDAGCEIGPQHPLAAEVAALIGDMTGMQRVAFCNTGSEAVMGAMRVARTVTGRSTIAIFAHSYHGIFDEVIVRGTRSLRSIAAAPGILASAVENVLVLDYGSDAALATLRQRAHELAAIMIEPVQGRNPTLQPQAFVQALRAICDEAGCALIFDEVVTGFRIAPGGAQEFYGVRADIASYGKIIGGGLPLAAIAGASRWMDALDGGDWRFGDDSSPQAGVTYFAGTFVRHPLALAASRAALLHLKRRGPALQRALNERTRNLIDRLNAMFARTQAPMTAVGFSSLWRMVVDEGQPFAGLFWYALRANGLHVYEQFNCFLSEAHGDAEIERIVAGVSAAVEQLLDARLLVRRAATTPARECVVPIAAAVARAPMQALPDTVPLTDGQLEKWLGSQYSDSATLAYNEAIVLTFDGAFETPAMKRALELIWSRHEAFRLHFASDGRSQVLQSGVQLPLREFDFSGPAAAARLDALCDVEMHTPFDLTRAPLVRMSLVRLGERRHALHLLTHHLVMDGWSFNVFTRELEACYNAFVRGREPRLAPAESFLAYVRAEHARRAGNGAQLDFWKRQFAELPGLAAAKMHPPERSADFSASTERHVFGGDLADALRREARRRGVTLYALLLASFAAFFARLQGRLALTIGIPFAGQILAGSDALIGDGVNTLPLRLHVDAQQGFGELVASTHRRLLDAAENQDLTLLNILHGVPSLRRGTLGAATDVVFNLNPRMRTPAFDGLELEWHDCRHAALLWNVFFNFNESGTALALDLHYRTALHDAATIQRWIAQFENLLGEVAASAETFATPDTPAFADGIDGAALSLDDDASLISLIEAQVQRSPEASAIACESRQSTYAQLWHDSAKVARRLLDAGVERGALVGLCMGRRIELLVAALGILRAGAAYVPLDMGFPPLRLQSMIGQARLRQIVVFDTSDLPDVVAHAGCTLVALGASDTPVHDAPLPRVAGQDLAYVLFTSGSTGEPKGVRITHRNLVNLLLAMRECPGFTASDVLCAVTTLSFDIAGLELYLPLVAGARIELATEEQIRDPQLLLQLIHARGVSVLQTTPTLLRLVLDSAGSGSLKGLRLLVGGEAMPREFARDLSVNCAQLWNMYGPTETTIWSTVWQVAPGDGSVPVPLGRPIANTCIHVLDESGAPVAEDEQGEIWIGGAGVADGYLYRPDLTAERFRRDPFAADGRRMYRTGDIGSWRDGVLHFHGRVDDQVKLRGFRIELGDVEAAARSAPQVRDAAAVVREFGDNDSRLVVFVAAPDRDGELALRVREHLRGALPAYMRPNHVVVLDALPRTPNGKIDRNALPTPLPGASPGAATAQLEDAREAYLAAMWRQLIGVADVRAEDNFFELGGDSLLAVDMMARVERETGRRINVLTIATGTLTSIAGMLPQSVAPSRVALDRTGWFGRLRSAFGVGRAT